MKKSKLIENQKQPQSRPRYETPLVMSLDELATGQGFCGFGSGDATDGCFTGNVAAAGCSNGSAAGGACSIGSAVGG